MQKTPSPFLIAEVAQAHDGSFDKAIAYIDAVAKTGVQAIKFQTHLAQAESSIYEPFRIKMQTDDKSRYDYWKRMEFSIEEWQKLKEHTEKNGLEFMSSPFSNAAVDLLEKVGVNRYKVGSGEVTNFLLLQKIAQTKKPLILSSGMSSYAELDKTVEFLKSLHVEFSILQCTTSYPTQPENYGLNVIAELKKRYGVQVGFSDHSARIDTGIAAVTLGAELLEFHVKLDNNESNPDASSSLTIDETKQLVKAVQSISTALNTPVDKNDASAFETVKSIFEKSLAVNKSLKAGDKLLFEDLEAKKPKGYGIDASRFQEVLGKSLLKDKHPWEFLTTDDVQL
ncbi:N-acetylneuraminate synthase family protein [Planktosalinus lacus]|uniref:N-acetylneuraminate synthase n=1 Tax=Planktosalinus lacus TaxID=1526573 RepID=A0A8J2VB17_9FLAO|nr:N-acetylneuraminate synthase family protein [Planktosalinus lacus]GGD97102.1 N-acetylneuraminate synthase [Planktosalinus lacus]